MVPAFWKLVRAWTRAEAAFHRLRFRIDGSGTKSSGTGTRWLFPSAAIKRDLRLMLIGARRVGVPLLDRLVRARQAAMCILPGATTSSRKSPSRRIDDSSSPLIHAEQDKAYLKKRFGEGRIKPLYPAPDFDAGSHRSQRAHRRHDGRGAMEARSRSGCGRGARGPLERHRDLCLDAGDARLPGGAWHGTRQRFWNAALLRSSIAKRPTACSRGYVKTTS